MRVVLRVHFIMFAILLQNALGLSVLRPSLAATVMSDTNSNRVRITSCLQKMIVNQVTADFSGKTIDVRVGDDPTLVSIDLQSKVGSGLGANVYQVSSKYFEDLPKAQSGVVVKLPHSWRWKASPEPLAKFNSILETEYDDFQALKAALPSLHKEPNYPKDFGWTQDPGHFPFAEILGKGKLDNGGSVLFKQRVRGNSTREMAKEYGDQLSPAVTDGLRKIYALSQVLYRNVQVDGHPFHLDIYPSNFIWVEKPSDLKAMGLREPSFVLVEASNHPKPIFQENYSFDQFVKDYQAYIRINGK